MDDRTCEYCGDPLPADARSDQRFCSRSHKSAARKQRRRREKTRAGLVAMGLPLDSYANDADIRARWTETDARIHAMIAAEEARRVPQAQAAEWAAYARRHNTIHPDELAARIARGQQARADDWQQGTARFQRASSTLAEQARASRAHQRRPVMTPMSERDMDELEPPTMVEDNVFRSGYRHANAYR